MFDSHVETIKFLSTPSARRATQAPTSATMSTTISIHALREEGDTGITTTKTSKSYFYPRPPRGGRPGGLGKGRFLLPFLSTPSARRATRSYCQPGKGPDISIHALREEGDRHLPPGRGQRRGFLSTPSARRATTG